VKTARGNTNAKYAPRSPPFDVQDAEDFLGVKNPVLAAAPQAPSSPNYMINRYEPIVEIVANNRFNVKYLVGYM
jgi:hypothetical protein